MDGWSFNFKINPLFFLTLIIFSLVGMFKEVIIVFILVILHEFSHVFVAWLYGFRVKSIEIFLFGGMAEFSGLLEMEPWQEIKVALAGPIFNLILAGIFFFLKSYILIYFNEEIFNIIISYNIILAVFNLLPALPLDGGRVMRGLLVYKLGFNKGTHLAIKIAKYIAVLGGVTGFTVLIFNKSNIWFLILSFFVYGAAIKEEKQFIYRLLAYITHRKEIINKMSLSPVFIRVVRGESKVKEIITYINPSKFNLFYVLDSGIKIRGIVSETQLLDYYFTNGNARVRMIDILENK
jgi:stage IV sporulation protein FB